MPASVPQRDEVEQRNVDPAALERSISVRRARRRAQIERERERRRARKRFWVLLAALLFYAVFLALTVWDQVQALFGL